MKYIKEELAKIGITNETLKRAGRTFIQSAAAYVAVNLVAVDFTGEKELVKSALCGLAVSAVAAGISAVMNLNKNKEN